MIMSVLFSTMCKQDKDKLQKNSKNLRLRAVFQKEMMLFTKEVMVDLS